MKQSKIDSFIILVDERNKDNHDYPVLGINKDKTFMPTAANMEGIDTCKYKVVKKGTFVFSGMQTGRDMCIRIGLYDKDIPALISPAYTTFVLDETKGVLPEYFFLTFNREESDRYGAFISDSSVRANLDWNRFLDIEIPLPSLAEQQKAVNAWRALREIKEQNEAIAAPLMQVCQSYIQELKHGQTLYKRIGDYIKIFDKTNKDGKNYPVYGLNKDKTFMPTVANTENVNLNKYKIVEKGLFAYSGMQTGRDVCIRIAYYDMDSPALISPAYSTFIIEEQKGILSEYFMLLFKHSEMDRLGWFYSDSSVRSNLDWSRFVDIQIPLPPLSVQQAIVNIYNCANEAKRIAAEADRMSREVCPALIQHVIHY